MLFLIIKILFYKPNIEFEFIFWGNKFFKNYYQTNKVGKKQQQQVKMAKMDNWKKYL